MVKRECPTYVTTANLEVYNVTQNAIAIIINKGKILAKRINV